MVGERRWKLRGMYGYDIEKLRDFQGNQVSNISPKFFDES